MLGYACLGDGWRVIGGRMEWKGGIVSQLHRVKGWDCFAAA